VAVLTVTPIVATGVTPTLAAASAGGDQVPTGNKTFLMVTNGSASAVTVTAVTTQSVSGLAVADAAVSVAAGTSKFIGPFPASLFANASNNVDITYSAVTSVTVGAFSI